MTARSFSPRFLLSALAAITLSLGAACTTPSGGPDETGQSPTQGQSPSQGQSPTQAQSPSQGQSPTQGQSPARRDGGKAWMVAEVARLSQAQPALVRTLRDLTPRRTRGGQLRFSDPATAETGAAAVLLERLLSSRDPAPVRRALVEILPEIGCPCGDVLTGALDTEPDAEVRTAMVEALQYAPKGVAEAGLRKALSDPAAEVRVAAAFVIPFRSDASLLRADLLRALDDPDPAVQDEAARAAGILRLPEATTRLEERLSGARADSRLHALRALHRIDARKARQARAPSRLVTDPDPRVARLAATIEKEQP